MADYNIYIHSMDGEGGGASQNGTPTFNPTAPWGSQESGGGGSDSQQLSKESPNFIADAKKTAKVAMKNPWIAVAYAIIKTAYTITKTVSEFDSIQTGNFRMTNNFHNYEAAKSAVFHPISTTIQTLKTMQLNKIEDQRREMQRSLLGDSEINRYSNRGY